MLYKFYNIFIADCLVIRKDRKQVWVSEKNVHGLRQGSKFELYSPHCIAEMHEHHPDRLWFLYLKNIFKIHITQDFYTSDLLHFWCLLPLARHFSLSRCNREPGISIYLYTPRSTLLPRYPYLRSKLRPRVCLTATSVKARLVKSSNWSVMSTGYHLSCLVYLSDQRKQL